MYLNYTIKWDGRCVKGFCYETNTKGSDGSQLLLIKLGDLPWVTPVPLPDQPHPTESLPRISTSLWRNKSPLWSPLWVSVLMNFSIFLCYWLRGPLAWESLQWLLVPSTATTLWLIPQLPLHSFPTQMQSVCPWAVPSVLVPFTSQSLSLRRRGLPKVGMECLEKKIRVGGTRGRKGEGPLLFASCSLPQPHHCFPFFSPAAPSDLTVPKLVLSAAFTVASSLCVLVVPHRSFLSINWGI